MRKTCRALKDMVGLDLTPGGLSQALVRVAKRLKPQSDALLDQIKAQDVLYTDETSWWVGGSSYSLWVATNEAGVAYRIVPSRSKVAAQDFLGEYQGVLVSDCLNIYDALTPLQHKCYAHHLKAIKAALELPSARGSPWLQELRALLKGAMAFKDVMSELDPEQVKIIRAALDENANRLLVQPRPGALSKDPAEQAQARIEEKVRLRFTKQRDHLFVFLDHLKVDATNNQAERDLRPAIPVRKLSCGNKTEQGARTFEVLASLAATAHKKADDFIQIVARAMQKQRMTHA